MKDKLSREELLKWLEEKINRSCLLQASHPHLAWYPNEQDKQNWEQIKSLLTFIPEKKLKEFVEIQAELLLDSVVDNPRPEFNDMEKTTKEIYAILKAYDELKVGE